MNDIYRVGDKLLSKQDTGLVSGFLPMEIPTVNGSDLTLSFNGGKMGKDIWLKAKSFLQWTFNSSGGEGQIRLFYNPTLQLWDCCPFEQFVSKGLSTDEKKDSDLSKKVIETMLEKGYINMGTLHHHCSIGAFQSGVDLADEIKQNGLHITLGYMDKDVYGYHSRATFRGICYSIIDSEWIEELDLNKVSDDLFPPEWKSYVVEKPIVPVTVQQFNKWDRVNPYNDYHDSWADYGFYGSAFTRNYESSIHSEPVKDTTIEEENQFKILYDKNPKFVESILSGSIDEYRTMVNEEQGIYIKAIITKLISIGRYDFNTIATITNILDELLTLFRDEPKTIVADLYGVINNIVELADVTTIDSDGGKLYKGFQYVLEDFEETLDSEIIKLGGEI